MLTVYIVFILSIGQLMWLDHIKGLSSFITSKRGQTGVLGRGVQFSNRPNFGGSILKMHKMFGGVEI